MADAYPRSEGDSPILSRRRFLAAAGGATVALTAAACGSSRTARTKAAPKLPTLPAQAIDEPPFRTLPGLDPPVVLVDRRPADPGDDVFVLTDVHRGGGQQGPLIVDRAGQLKWFAHVSDHGTGEQRVMNVRMQTYADQPVLTYWVGSVDVPHPTGHYEIYDRRYRQLARVEAVGLVADLHEFLITPQGTALLIAYGQTTGEIPAPDGDGTRLGSYLYCCAQEVDIASGRLLMQWRSDHEVPFTSSRRLPVPDDPETPWDYFHMNSIAIDPADGNLIISSRNMWQVYKVHRRTGQTLWRLGGIGSDFKVSAAAAFAFQHHVVPHAGGLFTIFDNESGPPAVRPQSRALSLHVDETRRQVTMVRQRDHQPPLLSDAMGSVQPLAHGHVFAGWGAANHFTEWDRQDAVVFDARLSRGMSYRAFQERWEGTPAQPPDLAVTRHAGHTLVYVSWNGATVHRRWRVCGGAHEHALKPFAIAEVKGFETEIALAHPPQWLALEALDAGGQVIGRSRTIRLAE